MTSPEPRDSPERLSSPGDSNSNGENGDSEQLEITNSKERKTSGGFFAKRFGITKMKDHTTKKDRLIDTNSANNSPMEFKPLKVCLKLSKQDSNVSTYSQDHSLATGAGSLPSSQAGVQRAAQAEQLQGEDLETKQQCFDDCLRFFF